MKTINKEDVKNLFNKFCKRVPSCGESLFQCDDFVVHAQEILDEICEQLGVYEELGEDNDC